MELRSWTRASQHALANRTGISWPALPLESVAIYLAQVVQQWRALAAAMSGGFVDLVPGEETEEGHADCGDDECSVSPPLDLDDVLDQARSRAGAVSAAPADINQYAPSRGRVSPGA